MEDLEDFPIEGILFMRPLYRKISTSVGLPALIALMLTACGGGSGEVVREVITSEPEVIVVTATPGEGEAEPVTDATPEGVAETATGSFTEPHPMLGDINVRRALAYCTNRPELILSVYPFLEEEARAGLLMDSFIPQDHWALAEDITRYPFDPEQGNALLEEAGWTLPEGQELGEGAIRANEDNDILSLKFTTTDAQFRQTWATILEQQLLDNCGIQIIRTHAPASWWFGGNSGLQRRDFELGAYAWVGEPDPKGVTLYACNQIPLPENNWEGQNYMGWCNETASRAIIAANNTLDREERIEEYATFQQEFTSDMVSLPLFQRLEAQAISPNLTNFVSDPTEYATASVSDWVLEDGGDSIVIGFSQEPTTLFVPVESAASVSQAADLTSFRAFTKYNYDYQPVALTQLPTLDNGGAELEVIDVTEGDMVWTVDAEAVELAPGVEVVNAEGETVTYEEGDSLQMNKLQVTFEYVDGLTWEDGEPVKQEDFELAAKIRCDPASGVVSLQVCESREGIEFAGDTEYTVTYLPGALPPEYFIYTAAHNEFGNQEAYPAHRVIETAGEYQGMTLAEVPAEAWATLPEVAENPLSNGPYRLVEWQKGQRMIFESNPEYYAGEVAVPNLIIQIIGDTNQAVAQLLTGEIDVLEKSTLGAGPEVETVLEAAEQGEIQAFLEASPTWEHMDMNLFVP
jgi:ABC-type transport system substrate-binding protein